MVILDEEKSALINKQTNVVENIVQGNYVELSIQNKDENIFIIPCTRFNASPGDTFINGTFYREGKPVEYLPTIEERIAILEEQNRKLIDILVRKNIL